MNRQGNVSDAVIERSAGHAALDEAALGTVRLGTPVPPSPPQVEGDAVRVVVPVEFFIRRR